MSTLNDGLVFWRDLTPFPTPLHAPGPSAPRILIVGGGVIGLTTAWVLLDKGYHVTVVAKEWASYGKEQRLTSQIAGALWEYPPAVCGQHTDEISLQYSKRWSMVSYHIWDAIASFSPPPSLSSPPCGVRMSPAAFFFPAPVDQNPRQAAKMREIAAAGVRGFRHDAARIVEERGVNGAYSHAAAASNDSTNGGGIRDAYEHLAPVIDTDACMAYLRALVAAKGAALVTQTLSGDLVAHERGLCHDYAADAIVNCTGLAASELAADETCYPVRGALLRVLNNGARFPKVTTALAVAADAGGGGGGGADGEIVFLVPRNDDVLLVGGIAEREAGALDLATDSPVVRRMRARCNAFLPGLERGLLDPAYPLAQGLRPFRRRNVRVERDGREHEPGRQSRVVHNYGHGGAGWSLSFGCAADVVVLLEEALRGEEPAEGMGVEVEERTREVVQLVGHERARAPVPVKARL